ncbi:aminotransferase class I/II-fold pyridoxal phosphate-dependent enzyme [Gynuella sunshinyii]|uniref:Cystathionine beta-lyase/cystathionine gamma-synthase n=1 Tax=Gynuella sunshinyii YC6258 TaxID=1445510 RepID=A0A0C5VG20_9GAMM|nr:aminotransferase class I/II-fold pyridoxal phosphate-dependent enzyme [Gynuella sunshinyii]AJQ92338.1 cystathionine beta-lyase/cystathionine gamma-synthase [Gynuella sunshinyii YC6258]
MKYVTEAVHASKTYLEDMHSEAIAMTSAYDFASAEEAAQRFSGTQTGNVYSRFTNPGVELFEHRLAALEGTEAALGVASGMGAYLLLGLTFLRQGDHVLLASGIFGTTTHLFKNIFGQFGITTTTIAASDLNAWSDHMTPHTRMVIVETPTNPLMEIANLRQLADIARKNNALFVVDNTLLTPVFQRPIEFGADIVLHSAGKFLDGQGRCVAGALAGRQEHIDRLRLCLRTTGVNMSPFNAWILSKGLETLKARMLLHEHNSLQIYQWLKNHPAVEQVISTFDENHPDASLIASQQKGHCPIISFRLNADQAGTLAFIDRLGLIKRCTNIGDAQTMITHPATTTHCRYPAEERNLFGISDNLLRICIGLEEPEDVIEDLAQAMSPTHPQSTLRVG